MWKTNALGQAVWQTEESAWWIDARGAEFAVRMGAVGEAPAEVSAELVLTDQPEAWCRLTSVAPDALPAAGEHYVRGQEWHVNYPQHDGSFALRLAFLPIVTTATRIVMEVRVSIQTDLLDTHPRIDIQTNCQGRVSPDPSRRQRSDQGQAVGCEPISVTRVDGGSVAVLLGPHDSPFTTDHSTDSLLRLRLFGEFLEKGVIRKARPWIVVDRRPGGIDQAELQTLWARLCESPLPLTP